MKDIITKSFFILIISSSIANAVNITSPIYIPQKKETIIDIQTGYSELTFNKVPANQENTIEEFYSLALNGKTGITEKTSFDYGFNSYFSREIQDRELSNSFSKYYFGFTSRTYDSGKSKLDLNFKIGQEETTNFSTENQIFLHFGIKYGLDLGIYNTALSINGNYFFDYEMHSGINEYEFKKDPSFSVILENELALTSNITAGLDLFFTKHLKSEIQTKNNIVAEKLDGYNEIGLNADINYALVPQKTYLGCYFTIIDTGFKMPNLSDYKDLMEYSFGLKLNSKF